MINQPTTLNNNRATPAVSGLSSEVGELTRAPRFTGPAGGNSPRIRNPEHRAKAERFWANLTEKRRQPGHCCRCGKPHAGKFRQCDPCRARVAQLKAKRMAGKMTLAELNREVKQCRREVTKLREIIKQMQRASRRAYGRAYAQRKVLRKYHDAYPTITTQELASVCHAYDSET